MPLPILEGACVVRYAKVVVAPRTAACRAMDVMAILHTANVKTRKLWHLVAPWVVKTRKLWHLVAPWVVPLVAYRKAILVAALPLLAFYLDCYENWPRWYWNNYQHCTARGRVPILIGTHHKSGTVLMRHIMSDTCRALKCRMRARPGDVGGRPRMLLASV